MYRSQEQDLLKLNKNLETEKAIALEVSADFQKKYTDTAKELSDVKEKIPSRLVWASVGAGGATLFFTIIAILLATR